MNNVVQTREAAKEDEKHEKEPFVFDKDDEFYMAPAIGRLLHYRSAAILCGLVEITILIVTLSGFFSKFCYSLALALRKEKTVH